MSGPQSANPVALHAMLSLLDCGLIRASWGHPGFYALWEAAMVSRRLVKDRPAMFDYSLNRRGREVALRAHGRAG
jgi:hypothetical protein